MTTITDKNTSEKFLDVKETGLSSVSFIFTKIQLDQIMNNFYLKITQKQPYLINIHTLVRQVNVVNLNLNKMDTLEFKISLKSVILIK
jgi:hypothetical protein